MRLNRTLIATSSTLLALVGAVSPAHTAPDREGSGTDYFVSGTGSDANDGTSPESPFRTIQAAADRTTPGSTVYIMDGVYGDTSPQGVVTASRSGEPGAPITYRPYPGHHPVLKPVSGWDGFTVMGASYITVEGLEIKGNSDNITLEQAQRESSPTNAAMSTNCLIVRPDDENSRNSHHITMRNNHTHKCPGAGIAAMFGDHFTIENNLVHSNSWYASWGNSGISILAPVDVDNETGYKNFIRNNVTYDNENKIEWWECDCISDGNGIIVDSTLHAQEENGEPYRGRTLVANNISYNNGGTGIHAYSSSHVDIVNNTAYLNSRSTEINNPNIGAWASEDVRVLNNISVARPGKATNSMYGNTDVRYDYNVYYGGAEPETLGLHDILGDPGLRRPGIDPASADFQLLAGSAAIDSGKKFPMVRQDFSGVRRPAGAGYDRGAHEFVASDADK
ncbi:right-handed parallel beta-helix repeat-containing protein [Streptomyces sp. NPDC006460]|uniref:right-handed parallel beta-helix repeat-containing protein n=1 Tax=Streptomyces sp. NPDC006460 TaxID=3154304 RepID=UPI0033BD858F